MNVNTKEDVKNIIESLTPESREELDHLLESEGYQYDTLENFLSMEGENSEKLRELIKKFDESIRQNDKDESIDEIIDIIR